MFDVDADKGGEDVGRDSEDLVKGEADEYPVVAGNPGEHPMVAGECGEDEDPVVAVGAGVSTIDQNVLNHPSPR